MNDVFRQIAYFITADNAKQLTEIMVKLAEEINPPPKEVDGILIHDLRMALLKLPCDNLPQKKRIRKLLDELEEVISSSDQQTG